MKYAFFPKWYIDIKSKRNEKDIRAILVLCICVNLFLIGDICMGTFDVVTKSGLLERSAKIKGNNMLDNINNEEIKDKVFDKATSISHVVKDNNMELISMDILENDILLSLATDENISYKNIIKAFEDKYIILEVSSIDSKDGKNKINMKVKVNE
ncbi:MAG: hypothetical protein E6929_10660 [Clostridium sp.]|nr:hypothetical protein [Clostridium sp.]